MVLGDAEPAGQALMRAYIGETMLSGGRVYMPERGIGSLSEALAAACSDAVRVSTPVRRIVVADAVICAVPGTKVPDLISDLPEATRRALSAVNYSTGCRVVIGLDHSPLPPGSALPGDHEGLFYRVYRWEEALCMGTPGMLAAVAKILGQLPGSINSLFLAGDYMGIPSVNGALSSGHTAATEAAELLVTRRELGRGLRA